MFLLIVIDYMTPVPGDPDREEDDATWLLEAAEGYEPEEEPQPYFDVVEFERFCMEGCVGKLKTRLCLKIIV